MFEVFCAGHGKPVRPCRDSFKDPSAHSSRFRPLGSVGGRLLVLEICCSGDKKSSRPPTGTVASSADAGTVAEVVADVENVRLLSTELGCCP